MDDKQRIVEALNRIQERAGMLRHGRLEVSGGINLAETHCIDRIGTLKNANVTKLSSAMEMTRGAISKICKKLLCKGLIESYRREDNQKEIYFRLTQSGSRVFDEHKKAHDKAGRDKIDALAKYSQDELSVISRFMDDLNRLSYLKLADQMDLIPEDEN